MTKEIELTQGFVALIDDEDFERVSQHKWSVNIQKYTRDKGIKYLLQTPYYSAKRTIRVGEKQKTVLLHRFILGVDNPKIKIDHIDRNTLNNQRTNLRICTNDQNNKNSSKRGNTSSKYKGVSWDKEAKKWRSKIMFNKKSIPLGTFILEHEAALVYNEAAKKYFGEFAYLNPIVELPVIQTLDNHLIL